MPAPLTAPVLTLRPYALPNPNLSMVYFNATHPDQTNVAYYTIQGCQGVACSGWQNISGMGLGLTESFFDPISATPPLSTDPAIPNRYRMAGRGSAGEYGPWSNIVTHYPGDEIEIFIGGAQTFPAAVMGPGSVITETYMDLQVESSQIPADAIPVYVQGFFCAGVWYTVLNINLGNGIYSDVGTVLGAVTFSYIHANPGMRGPSGPGMSGLGFDEVLCSGYGSIPAPSGGWTRANLLSATFGYTRNGVNENPYPDGETISNYQEVEGITLKVAYVNTAEGVAVTPGTQPVVDTTVPCECTPSGANPTEVPDPLVPFAPVYACTGGGSVEQLLDLPGIGGCWL